MTPHEQQVIDKLKQSYDPAWAALLEELVPRYLKLFRQLTQDDNTAEDFTHEAIFQTIQAIGKLP